MGDRLFVGVTTEQGTANLVPLVQLRAGRYLALDSALAAERGWGAGLLGVLQRRGIEATARSWTGERFSDLLAAIKGFVRKEEAVTWILGGGLKVHQVAVWECFHSRGGGDTVVYADPGARELRLLSFTPDEKLLEEKAPFEARLVCEDVVGAFGRRVHSKHADRLEDASEPARWRADAVYRRSWSLLWKGIPDQIDPSEEMSLAAWNRILKEECKDAVRAEIVEKLQAQHGQPVHALSATSLNVAWNLGLWTRALGLKRAPIEAFGRRWSKYSYYFERLLDQIVFSEAGERLQIDRGVEVGPYGTDHAEQEHDILFTMKDGTLVSLDAKTFDVGRKDLDARLMNLTRAAGRMSRFVVAIPYHVDDLAEMPKTLRELPFALTSRDQAFVIVGADRNDLWLRKNGSWVDVVRKGAPDAIRCRSVENWLAGLR